MTAPPALGAMPAPTVRVEPAAVAPGARADLTITLEVPEGGHIQSHTPREPYLIPTVVEVDSTADVVVGSAVYPQAVVERFEWSSVELDVYRGRVAIAIPIEAGPRARGRTTLTVRVRYQRCTTTACLPPAEHVIEVTVDVTPTHR